MSPAEWLAAAPDVIDGCLAEIGARDPRERGCIDVALAAGGRLRLVIDRPRGQPARLRVRLIKPGGPNQWVHEAKAPPFRLVT